jgi:HrpA-like RNA helicase
MDTDSFESIAKLPIYERRKEILASVAKNQVTIITAETGAGKSTQVPQFLAEAGYTKIIVTQPRILAARNLSSRVRQEYSWSTGKDATDLVGYRTAHERDDSQDNVILYCTDGLQLVRELTGSGIKKKQILVLDEVHEWNENMEVLVAWAKKRCAEEASFKLVLMSATIEADNLAKYFGIPAPIIVAGRSFPVQMKKGKDVIDEIVEQLSSNTRNILVFLPGKAEIEYVADQLSKLSKGTPILPLHGQLDPEVQQRVFEHYSNGKVVLCTNIAQTSITIDDIDTVIDSGLERRSEVRSGVEGLFIAEVSQADCMQRAGRAGRTKAGIYVLAKLGTMPCTPLERRPAFGVPEIVRKHIDRLVLRLAAVDIDIEDLQFFHSPSTATIQLAKYTLLSLGALTKFGQVTDIGKKMERFPVESSYARMLIESEQYSSSVQSKLATIIAIQEVGGIIRGSSRYTEWRRYTKQSASDLIAQYDLYCALPMISEDLHEELGIIGKNVDKAEEVNERLSSELNLEEASLAPIDPSEVEPLLRSIIAGQLHELWIVQPNGEAMHYSSSKVRELSGGTVVKHAGLVVGTPFDLEVPTSKGTDTLHLLNDLTAVDPKWLEELAPGTFKTKPGKIYYDSRYGAIARRSEIIFGKKSFETAGVPLLNRSGENQKLFIEHYAIWIREQLERERQSLHSSVARHIQPVTIKNITQRLEYLLDGAVSLHELSKSVRIAVGRLSRLENYYGDVMRSTKHEHRHKEHKGKQKRLIWKPPHKRKGGHW